MMSDKEFLWWIHERLVKVHQTSEFADWMHHFRAIIVDTPLDKVTPNFARMDTDADLLRKAIGRVGG